MFWVLQHKGLRIKIVNQFGILCGWHVNRKDVTKWRNDEFWNFHATYSNVFFWSTKLRQPRQCRDSCTYYIIFQNFVISSFRHIFSIEMPTTLDSETDPLTQEEGNISRKILVKFWRVHRNSHWYSRFFWTDMIHQRFDEIFFLRFRKRKLI